MSEKVLNEKRIAKNTILLYGRMLLTMAISLYTSRMVLNILGIEDYGIYNVVGGIVTMFAFFNTAMITSTQRYLTYELGRGNPDRLRLVFTTSIRIHTIITLIIVILTETIGLWFFYNKMVIPPDRLTAAMWVLQLSVLTMAIQVMSVPYNSLIIAHEDFGVFSVISILYSFLNLGVVFILLIGNIDKLILYAVLIAVLQLFIRFLYTFYCSKHYKEVKFVKDKDNTLMKDMGGFAGWNLWGNLASMLMGTGINMLLNVFFGPAVNAARAIAVQVETAIMGFATNFMMAVNPQITKLYAKGNYGEMHDLIFRSSKFSFFLLFTLCLPVILEAKVILTIWLKIVPEYSVQFLRLLLVIIMVNSLTNPLQTAAAATGNVKKYQTVVGCILLSIVPISYVALKLGGDPTSVYVVYLCVCMLAFFSRLLVIRPLLNFSLKQYFNRVVSRCLFVTLLAFGISYLVQICLTKGLLLSSILVCLISVLIAITTIYSLGLTKGERVFINTKIYGIVNKLYHK